MEEKMKDIVLVLRKRLTILCIIMTSLVLTIVIGVSWIAYEKQWITNQRNIFSNQFQQVCNLLRTSNIINHTHISEMELFYQQIIYIEDNQIPLLYRGAWNTTTKRSILIERLLKQTEQNGISIRTKPISLEEMTGDTYTIYGDNKDRYFGSVFLLSKQKGLRSLVMLQEISDKKGSRSTQRKLFLLYELIGCIAMSFISNWLVKKMLKPVEESRRRQTEFIAAASHELRSPLTVIRANAFALIEDYNLETEKKESQKKQIFVWGIEKECRRMAGLIDDMLVLASVDANTWKTTITEVDIDTLLMELYDFFYPYCIEKKCHLKLELGEELLPYVRGDKDRIWQILSILIQNAISYTKPEDSIILTAYTKKGYCYIEVQDHGIGIPDEEKKHIFERFYRIDKSRKDKEHYGLGLSIAKELIMIQNGEIKVKDTKGGGATFCITLLLAV